MEFTVAHFATLLMLIGLELVLGIDNILLISIVTGRLKPSEQPLARKLALGIAFFLRVLFVLGAAALVKMTTPILWHFSLKDIILLAGGAFLLFKAIKEIHHVVEHPDDLGSEETKAVHSFGSAVTQLVLLDIVFSIDSVITAVGLTDQLWVIIAAVLISFLIVLWFASSVSNFIDKNPTLKILALSFLVTIGVTLFVEGMGHEVSKGYIYLPMGFALAVELLQMRFTANRNKKK